MNGEGVLRFNSRSNNNNNNNNNTIITAVDPEQGIELPSRISTSLLSLVLSYAACIINIGGVLSFMNPRNNTTTSAPDHHEQVSEPTMAAVLMDNNNTNPRNNTIIIGTPDQQGSSTNHSIMITILPADRYSSDDSSNDDQQDGDYNNLKGTMKAVLATSLCIVTIDGGLIIHPVEPVHHLFLVEPYNTLLILSLSIGLGLAIYFIMSINRTGRNHTSSSTHGISTSDAEIALVLKISMVLGLITIFIALVMYRLMVSQTFFSVMLGFLLFFAIIGMLISLVCKKKKRNNIIQTVPTLESSAV